MKVNFFLSNEIDESSADIHTNQLTENIKKAVSILENDEFNNILPVKKGSDIVFLDFNDIYMVRVEDKQVRVYSENSVYPIKKALYQVEDELNLSFIRISKTTIVNMKKIDRVAPSLKGMMFIQLKNGLKDNISRKYLPNFKKALGL